MKPSRLVLLISLGLAAPLAGCGATGSVGTLVSAQSPPGTGAVNVQSQPQPINSLPPGAANISPAFGATQPSYASITFNTR